jgi:hypothetical protein
MYMTRESARKAARILFKDHGIKGAKIVVWENLGWHFSLKHPNFSIYPPYDSRKEDAHHGEFSCLASLNGIGGDVRWSIGKRYKTPKKALEGTLKGIKKAISKDTQLKNIIEKALGNQK